MSDEDDQDAGDGGDEEVDDDEPDVEGDGALLAGGADALEAPEGEQLAEEGGDKKDDAADEQREQAAADDAAAEDGFGEDDKENPEGEEDGEEGQEKPLELPLNVTIITECLSLLAKTGNGLSHAYVKCDLKERGVTDILLLSNYVHLRYLDISQNHLKDITPVGNLTHLLVLVANNNKIAAINLPSLPYLQFASFAHNRIKTLQGLDHPLLERLNLNFNSVKSFQNGLSSTILQKLHHLEMRGNKLTSLEGLNLPNLKNLFLAANQINSLEGADQLPSLMLLHLRENQLENLAGFSANNQNLQYINLRANLVKDHRAVEALQVLPSLKVLVMTENPLAEEEGEYRLEILIKLRRLQRLDKIDYSDDERQEAEQRIAEQAVEGNAVETEED